MVVVVRLTVRNGTPSANATLFVSATAPPATPSAGHIRVHPLPASFCPFFIMHSIPDHLPCISSTHRMAHRTPPLEFLFARPLGSASKTSP